VVTMDSLKCTNEVGSGHMRGGFELPSCVILLNGFPGVGKLTIAKAFAIDLRALCTPHRLLDNHLIIDAAHAIIPDLSSSNSALRREFRKIALDALKKLKEDSLVVILTAC
jgi:adenylylsulfate kinase-like enzyme